MSRYPQTRLRRLRRTPALRRMRRETSLTPDNFIQPLFIAENLEDAGPVVSMPGVSRLAIDELDGEIERIAAAGIPAVLLFGIPAKKDVGGSQAYAADGVIAQAIRRIKTANPPLAIIADVCLCEYTSHGHCGILGDGASGRVGTAHATQTGRVGTAHHVSHEHSPGEVGNAHPTESTREREQIAAGASKREREQEVRNDETLAILVRAAVAYADAGVDLVAPSGMMDGMVAAIRAALDDARHTDVAILSYAIKYASAFYGPFRDAADCAPQFGDRRTHQMDPANVREALAEARLDLDEGADMLMVKPAMPYLDVIRRVRDTFPEAPLAAYQVSGEYSMIKAAAANGWIDERQIMLESLTAIKRAGADTIITYFALEAARHLR